jgi:hypothetical protein
MFVLRLLLFVIGAAAGYVATVAAAFVFWSWIGSSGPDYTPLLIVLFIIAPVVAVAAGSFAASFPRRRRRREGANGTQKWRTREEPEREPPPRQRYGALQIGVMAACALIIIAVIVALRAPQLPH